MWLKVWLYGHKHSFLLHGFMLWFRRGGATYQGWSKFYEFSLADMRAAAIIIDRLCRGSGE